MMRVIRNWTLLITLKILTTSKDLTYLFDI